MKYQLKPVVVEAFQYTGDAAAVFNWRMKISLPSRFQIVYKSFGVVATKGELVLRDEVLRTETRVPVGSYLVIWPNEEVTIVLKEKFQEDFTPHSWPEVVIKPLRLGYFDGE